MPCKGPGEDGERCKIIDDAAKSHHKNAEGQPRWWQLIKRVAELFSQTAEKEHFGPFSSTKKSRLRQIWEQDEKQIAETKKSRIGQGLKSAQNFLRTSNATRDTTRHSHCSVPLMALHRRSNNKQ